MVFLLCENECVSEERLVWHKDDRSKCTDISRASGVSSLLSWVS